MKLEIEYKYCLECGGAVQVVGENMLKCTSCGFVYYVNARPCVGVVFRHKDEIGLCVRAIEPGKGLLDTIGGFLEYTENLEEAVKRETVEETGIEVDLKKIKYLGSCNVSYAFGGYIIRPMGAVFEYEIDDISQIRPNDDISAVKFFDIKNTPFEKIAFPELGDLLRNTYQKNNC